MHRRGGSKLWEVSAESVSDWAKGGGQFNSLYVYAVYNTKYMVSHVQQHTKSFLFEIVIKWALIEEFRSHKTLSEPYAAVQQSDLSYATIGVTKQPISNPPQGYPILHIKYMWKE